MVFGPHLIPLVTAWALMSHVIGSVGCITALRVTFEIATLSISLISKVGHPFFDEAEARLLHVQSAAVPLQQRDKLCMHVRSI